MSIIFVVGIPETFLINTWPTFQSRYEVTAENIIRVLTGRHDPSTPRNKRLMSDERSNVFIYLTGHGGSGMFVGPVVEYNYRFSAYKGVVCPDLPRFLS